MSAATDAAKSQSLENHARFVPGFHFVTGLFTIVVLGWSLYRVITLHTPDALLELFIGCALLGQFIYLRTFPLAVQDRVIRLEERLRLAALLPAELQPRAEELTVDQLIALRFASDGELPALTRKILDERIAQRKAIKALIVSWRADNLRA